MSQRSSSKRTLQVVLRTGTQASGDNGNPRPIMRKKTIDPSACDKKDDTDWRIVSININNFPTEKDGHDKAKLDLLRETIHASGADLIGISEMGRNENNLPFQKRPSNVTKSWVENGSSIASWNQRNHSSSVEPGGVLMLSKDRSTAHILKKGKDERNLGRWTWMTVKGKQNFITTIITTYRANNAQVTAQNQLGHIRRINCLTQPEEMWEEDLRLLIESKKNIGEVIVLGDFNANLNDANSLVNKFFTTLRMREIIIEKYGGGPATFFRGSETIDGIFGTEGISIRQGGYGGTYLTPGDHLYPWVDIEQRYIIGEARDDRPPPILKKATSKIPSVRNEFNRLINEAIVEHKLHEKAELLVETARKHKVLTSQEAELYEKIEERLRRAVKYADNRCRKARVGKVPFSKKQKELLGKMYVLKIIF